MAVIDVDKKYLILIDNLNIRTGPSTSYTVKDKAIKDVTVGVTKINNNWGYMGIGWISLNPKYVKLQETAPVNNEKVTDVKSETVKESADNAEALSAAGVVGGATINYLINDLGNSSIEGDDYAAYEPDAANYAVFDQNRISNPSNLKSMRGIHGFPYQHMDTVDMKISQLNKNIKFPYGRKFTERIINKMPVLLMTPGRPSFLEGYSASTKQSVLQNMGSMIKGQESALEQIMQGDKNGRYYTFRFNYKDYYDYVNTMCWLSAVYLRLGNRTIDGMPYRSYNWSNYVNSGFKGFVSGSQYVPFYIDSDNQISDSFSNTTGESMLDSGLNKLSDMGKEVDFLLGAGAGIRLDSMVAGEGGLEANMGEINKLLEGYSNPANIIEKLKTGGITLASGGQLIFPEIWKDHDYSKSYDVNMKLTSPDGDTESIYRNILVPLFHLLGFVLPLQMGYNGYRSPFLVKAIYKGLFNCEMGMVTSMSIRKGGEGSWNIDGLPTEVDVSFTIKDFYGIMAMTKMKDTKMLFSNYQLMDFVATTCGIAINKPDVLRKVEMYTTFQANKIINIPSAVKLGLSQAVDNVAARAFEGFMR